MQAATQVLVNMNAQGIASDISSLDPWFTPAIVWKLCSALLATVEKTTIDINRDDGTRCKKLVFVVPAPCAIADFLALVAKDDDGKDYATISELIGMTLSEVEQRNEEGTFAADVVYSGLPLPANPSVVAALFERA